MEQAERDEWGEQQPPGAAAAGSLLREARERRGMSVEDCALALRARAGQVAALERGDLSDFGAEIYARGFLRSYARLVDVDADEVLALHGDDPAFRGPVLPPREQLRLRRDPPGWLIGLVALVVVGVGLAAVLGAGRSRVPDTVEPEQPGLAQGGDAETGGADPADEPRPQPAPEPAPEPAGPPVDVVLTFEAASWLEVVVDDVAVQTGVLVPEGETLRFGGQQQVSLRFGNAGGVRVELNGAELGPAGRPGEVLRVAFGPDGPIDDGALSTTDG